MMPVPFFQVVDFLDWIANNRPGVNVEELDHDRLSRLAIRYLQEGSTNFSIKAMISRDVRQADGVDLSDVLPALLKVFQTCPMITENQIDRQMAHFAQCGRCPNYIRERDLNPNKAQLHPLLQGFVRFVGSRNLNNRPKAIPFRELVEVEEDDNFLFRRLIELFGADLLNHFEEYLHSETAASAVEDYMRRRSELMMSTQFTHRRDDSNLQQHQREDGSWPLGFNESMETAARRLADSVRILVEGNFYEEQVTHNPEVYDLLRMTGVLTANTVQSIEFISWLTEKHPSLDILASVPTSQLKELVIIFCEERKYQNISSLTNDVLKWSQGEGKRNILHRLIQIGTRAKRENKTYRSSVSSFKRYQTIPYHAIFLFLSVGNFPEFIKQYWEDINCLTGDHLDIYYSFEDVERRVSAYETIKEFRSLQVENTSLPAIILWRKHISESCVIPLGKLPHDDIFDIMKMIVQLIVEDKPLDEICIRSRNLVKEKTEALLPGTRIIVEKGEITMGDRIRTGDITNIGGIQNVGKFGDVIANLNSAGQQEFANALTSLKDAIMASTHLTEAQKQEQIGVINSVGEEAAKPTPNKTLLKMLGDGLMNALKAIPDVAKAAGALAPLLAKFI